MTAQVVSRWSRRYLLVAAAALVAWQATALLEAPWRGQVALGVYGFVFPVVFAKAYSLVPSYFDRQLAVPRAPAVQYPLTVLGAAGLAVAGLGGPAVAGAAGALAWAAGALAFVAALGWTVRDNLTGAETGTGEAKAERRPVDRYANRFVPVVGAYLLFGAYETAATRTVLPALLGDHPARATHLLAAGGAALLLFAVGFRLLPRFLVASPPRALVAVVLPAGAVGPGLVAATLPAGPWFQVGAAVEATAVVGFAAAYAWLFLTSDRRRVGFYGVLAGVVAGAAAAGLAVHVAVTGYDAPLLRAHARLNLLGLLGLSIVGVSFQFYPPGAGRFPGAGDRTALAVIALLAGGLAVETVGLVTGPGATVVAGRVVGLAGTLGYASLLAGLLRELGDRTGTA